MNLSKLLAAALFTLALTACGGGGGAATGPAPPDNSTTTGTPAPTSASSNTFKISLSGGVAANAIKGIQFEIDIPDGFTLRSNPATGETLAGVVTTASSLDAAQPSVASIFSTTSGVSLWSFGLITGTGIGSGALATLTCDPVPGYATPSASAFAVRNVKAVDGNAAVIPGVQVTVQAASP